nr:RHS repeat-associated core domain-containing protein [Burkholderia metallica]
MRYNRHRYYDPRSGRFVSQDPIGLAGGISVYQCRPSPTEWVDPLGLSRFKNTTSGRVKRKRIFPIPFSSRTLNPVHFLHGPSLSS